MHEVMKPIQVLAMFLQNIKLMVSELTQMDGGLLDYLYLMK